MMINNIKKTIIFVMCVFICSSAFAFNEENFILNYYWKRVVKLKPPQRPRIALVLGGGGARGLAHIGVLKVFEEEGIPIDIITGTSVGALVGSLYCAGVSTRKIEHMAENIGWGDLINVSGPTLAKLLIANSLLSSERMEEYLISNIGKRRFDELDIKFACMATDLMTGERIIFKEGEVVPAARASATLPGIFEPVEYRHRFLVDGGLLDNVPIDVAELLGADFIIAVSVAGDFSKNKISNVFMVLSQAINIQGKLLDKEQLQNADLVIEPQVGDISAIDLGQSRECIDAGVLAARKAVAALKLMIINKTSDYYLLR